MRKTLASLLFAVVVIAGCSGDETTITESDTQTEQDAPVVSSSDTVTNDIPQSVSLRVVDVDGAPHVENDGNVTMSGVEARWGDQACTTDNLAPGTAIKCEGLTPPYTLSGSGPQGQPFSVSG